MTATSEQSPNRGNDIGRFVARLGKLVVRPAAFWQDVKDAPPTLGEVVWPHMVILVGASALATFLGAVLGGRGFGVAFGQLFTSFMSSFAGIWAFAFAVTTIAATKGSKAGLTDCVMFGAYVATPMLLLDVISLLPIPYVKSVATILAMPWAFHLLALGVPSQLGVTESKAPTTVAHLCGALLVLWTALPTLLPAVVGALFGKH